MPAIERRDLGIPWDAIRRILSPEQKRCWDVWVLRMMDLSQLDDDKKTVELEVELAGLIESIPLMDD